jgi:hypothetical protein
MNDYALINLVENHKGPFSPHGVVDKNSIHAENKLSRFLVVYAVNYVSAHHVEEVEVHGDQDQNY